MHIERRDKMDSTIKALEAIVEALKDSWYRIVGGLAVDGYVGHLTRSHSDVDVIILEEELDRVQEALRKNSHSFTLFPYKVRLLIDGVAVDLGRFQRSQEGYWLVTLPEHKWPVDLLEKEEVTLEGIQFKVPSKEFLLSTRLMDRRRSKASHDRQILKRMGVSTQIAKEHRFPYNLLTLRAEQGE